MSGTRDEHPNCVNNASEAREYGDPALDDVELLDEHQPGKFRFEAPSDEDLVVRVSRVDDDATMALSADVPFEVFDETIEGPTVTVGEPVRHVVDGFTHEVVHSVDLRAGDEIDITVHGGTSDAYFRLLEPGEHYDQLAEPDAEDGGGGLYDLDPHDSFKVDTSGTHRVVVGTWDGIVAGYKLDVRRVD